MSHIVLLLLTSIIKACEPVLSLQRAYLLRWARTAASLLSTVATIVRVRVRLRWCEYLAAQTLEDATIEGQYCLIWVNRVPVVIQHAMARLVTTPALRRCRCASAMRC